MKKMERNETVIQKMERNETVIERIEVKRIH
jgi:hypothetical protein